MGKRYRAYYTYVDHNGLTAHRPTALHATRVYEDALASICGPHPDVYEDVCGKRIKWMPHGNFIRVLK